MSVRDDLLARVNIVDVVGKYVQLRRTGKNRLWLCPFHKEKTPSFTVAEDKQIYKCFGCGKWGNAVNFVMEAERIDYRDAIKELARGANFDLQPYERNPEITEKRQQDREKLKFLNKRMQEFFVSQLAWSPADTYVRDHRKLTSKTITDFGIGYAPDSYTQVIEFLKSKWFTHEDMLQAWLVSAGSNWTMPFFRNRVTFPIYDHIGNVVGFGWRALVAEQNPKYLNTTETPLYEKSQLLFGLDKARNYVKDHGFLIVVEWYMDVIALHQYGVPLGVATCGTALTADHIKLLKRHTDQVVLLFDNDQAGMEATARALKIAYQADFYPRAFGLATNVKDVDEWLTKHGETIAPWVLLEQSTDAFTFVMHQLASTTDTTNPVLRKKFQHQLFGILQTIQDYGILMIYLQQMWSLLHLTSAELTKEFKSRLQQQKRWVTPMAWTPVSKPVNPDPVSLVWALYINDFWRSVVDHPEVEKIMLVLKKLNEQDSSLCAFETTVSEECLTVQLWRERQLEGVTMDKRYVMVVWVVQKFLHELIKKIMKEKRLSSEQKQAFLHLLQKE